MLTAETKGFTAGRDAIGTENCAENGARGRHVDVKSNNLAIRRYSAINIGKCLIGEQELPVP